MQRLCHHTRRDWNSFHTLDRCRLGPFCLNQEPKFIRDWNLPNYVRYLKCRLVLYICTLMILLWITDIDAVELFVGKKLPCEYFPSYCVKLPKELCHLLGRKRFPLSENCQPRKFIQLAEAACHFPRCIAGSFHSRLRRGRKRVIKINLIEDKKGFGRCCCTCDSMLCDMLGWHVDNCSHIWVCWCEPSQQGLLFC